MCEMKVYLVVEWSQHHFRKPQAIHKSTGWARKRSPILSYKLHQSLMQVFIWLYVQCKLLKFVQYLQIK